MSRGARVQQCSDGARRVERDEGEHAGDGGGAVAEDERREELGPGLRRGQVAREGREGQGSGPLFVASRHVFFLRKKGLQGVEFSKNEERKMKRESGGPLPVEARRSKKKRKKN